MDKQRNTAAEVLKRVEKYLDNPLRRFPIDSVCNDLSIFDWWPEYLTKSKLQEMRQFLKEAIKLGYTGYVCFKVGATGCANGMWAHTELETDEGYSPNHCPTLYRSFTPAYRYWDVTDKDGNWDWEGKYKDDEDRRQNYDKIKTIKELEAFIEDNLGTCYSVQNAAKEQKALENFTKLAGL